MNVRDWLSNRMIDPEVALDAGVRYDPQKDAILYPRTGTDGNRIGWKVRHLSDNRQYNTPAGIPLSDTVPFTTSHAGADAPLVICEGETDALAFASKYQGYNVIGVPGATSFANSWAGLCAKYDNIYLIPDADEAGGLLVNKVCGLMPRTRVVQVPWGMDLTDALIDGENIEELMLDAAPVISTEPLRRTSYTFSGEISVPPGKLIELVSEKIPLRRRGKEWVGHCPFHDDETPSFMVDPVKGLFYCHGCRRGGDAVSYLREQGYTFREAKEML